MADQPKPLMPHATATWLVDNTGLSFEQIAEFCGLHILEVQAMADDLAGSKYTGRDPVHAGELTQEEIEKGQADAEYRLKMQRAPVAVSRTKGPRYTPVSKRQDKPDGIAWILRNHPEISDAQILCSQRELDAVVAKAAKNLPVDDEEAAPVVASGSSDREKLIEELHAEREANVKAAAEAAQEAEAAAWLEAKRTSEDGGEPGDTGPA